MTGIDTVFEGRQMPATKPDERLSAAAHEITLLDVALRPTTRCDFTARVTKARDSLRQLEKSLVEAQRQNSPVPSPSQAALMELAANYRHLRSACAGMLGNRKQLDHLPRIVQGAENGLPRIAALAGRYLRAIDYVFSAQGFCQFVETVQAFEALTLNELWTAPSFLRYVLFEKLMHEARALLHVGGTGSPSLLLTQLKSLRAIAGADWPALTEPLIAFDRALREDPAGAYATMDLPSRNAYRKRIAYLARFSNSTELQVANLALHLARQAHAVQPGSVREHKRRCHVGYYLVDQGFSLLAEKAGFHPSIPFRARQFVRRFADEFYIEGIILITLLLVSAVFFPVLAHFSTFVSAIIALAFLILPATQAAVDLVNNAVITFFDPEPLSRLDFSKGISADCTTLVAVPSLLLNEKQVRKLAADMEVRYLANRDRNLHYALLTDLADSLSTPHRMDAHPLIDLAAELINGLNAKYAHDGNGSFLLLHRHRQFNIREQVWMGWERKRGKLLDLNKLLAGEFDAFPVKAGPIDTLKQVRYVLTLDADTQLPGGVAAELAGTIAHPLNQAILDPERRIVTAGYGILQPRIGITVQSSTRSRLAAIFSGQTGFDLYASAASDAYQDLFGEGIFTGKGIYEPAIVHAVLNNRFPRNALLSHDLIEGAYARAGLVSNVELIEDYPSRYSAYSRRQHRWVRGDWQIARWITSRVPDELGHTTENPISRINRWKIFDNLRRSLVAPGFLALFIAAWMGLPGGPLYWTLVPVILLLLPITVQLLLGLTQAIASGQKGAVTDALSGFGRAFLVELLHLVLFPHTTLLVCDAVVRSLIRSFITGKRLLEWETAAQAESLSQGRAPIDRYLILAPLVPLCLAAMLIMSGPDRNTLFCAAPILLLWLLGMPIVSWLNRTSQRNQHVAAADEEFLTAHGLRIWRYFHRFSSQRHHFLIPDNVVEDGFIEAARVSPTNVGLLLNTRQAAHQLGFITTPDFAEMSQRTLSTIARLEKFRGHLYNWYDTETLKPLGSSQFVSTVDSGNLAASLYTLHSGTLDLLRRPLLTHRLFTGLVAYAKLLREETGLHTNLAEMPLPGRTAAQEEWITWLTNAEAQLASISASGKNTPQLDETRSQLARIDALLHDYLPWTLPRFKPLHAMRELGLDSGAEALATEEAIVFAEALKMRLARTGDAIATTSELAELSRQLQALVPPAINRLSALRDSLRNIAQESGRLAGEMEYAFLVDPYRQILSIGYDMQKQHTHEACYDMVASEARMATFLAIARGDMQRQSWLKLARDHTYAFKRFVLMSWSGTMFEYLMPSLWMRSYPGTMLANTQQTVVDVQRAFAASQRIPWGISESGAAAKNEDGDYHYHAYGIPQISLWHEATAGPVVAPYATFLALGSEARSALRNLRKLASSKWVGAYGFYEAADYTGARRKQELVREWMAHHQGMSLLAIVNLLHGNIVQQWFHANPVVQSAELLLHEKMPARSVLKSKLREFSPLGADA